MPPTSRLTPTMRLLIVVAGLLVTLVAVLWSLRGRSDDPTDEIKVVTSSENVPVIVATPPVVNPLDRAGLDPAPVVSAKPEPTLDELKAAADRAPPPTLTPEEIAAGRKTLGE